MCDRMAELGEHPVAAVLRHPPLVAGDGLGARLVDGHHQLAHLFGAEPRGDRRRALHVDREHRDLAQLGARGADRAKTLPGGADEHRRLSLIGIRGQRL